MYTRVDENAHAYDLLDALAREGMPVGEAFAWFDYARDHELEHPKYPRKHAA